MPSDPYEPIMRSDCEEEKQELIEEFLSKVGYLHTEIIRQIQVVSIDDGEVWRAKDYYELNDTFDKIKAELQERLKS